MSQIERAVQQVHAADLEGALSTLLEAWRARRLPEVADLVDELTRRLNAGREPLRWSGATGAGGVWRSHTGTSRPESLRGWGIGLLFEMDAREKPEMVEGLLGWADDPRVAAALVQVARRGPELRWWLPRLPGVWKRAFARVIALGDVRQVEPLATLESAWAGRDFSRHVPRYAAEAAIALQRLPRPEPTAAERVALDQLRAALAPTVAAARTADELLAEIYAHPDEDGPRHVYADFLQERGDPRGEFIALQMLAQNRPLTPDENQRAAVLLYPHARGWLGPIEPVVSKTREVRYERGFVVTCATSRDAHHPLASHPAWSTVRELHGEIDHGRMRSLRALTGVRRPDLEALVAGPPLALESLIVESSVDESPAPAALRPLLDGSVAHRLETLRCPTGWSSLAAWVAELDAARSPSLTTVDIGADPLNSGWQLYLERTPSGRFTSLRLHFRRATTREKRPLEVAIEVLAALPAGTVTELSATWTGFAATKADLARLRAALEHLQLGRCQLPAR